MRVELVTLQACEPIRRRPSIIIEAACHVLVDNNDLLIAESP